MKPTKAQMAILRRLAEGAVITVDHDFRWVLKQGNDVLREVSKTMRRTLRQNQWTHESYRDTCYRITDLGRAALAAADGREG